jgi:cystathionine beta-lyase/cystathionine gamma-synthase
VRRERGLSDGLVRLSVGLEDVRDLIEDVTEGLELAAAGAGRRVTESTNAT